MLIDSGMPKAFNLENKTKNCLSMKCNKSKCTKIRCACILVLFFLNLFPFCVEPIIQQLSEKEGLADQFLKLYLQKSLLFLSLFLSFSLLEVQICFKSLRFFYCHLFSTEVVENTGYMLFLDSVHLTLFFCLQSYRTFVFVLGFIIVCFVNI